MPEVIRHKRSGLRILLFVMCLVSVGELYSQNKGISFQRLELIELEESVRSVDSIQHTALKPFLEQYWSLDSVFGYYDNRKYYYAFGRKFLRDDLVEVKGEDFHFTFNPLWDLQLGWDFADTSSFKDSVRIFTNTRGLIIQGDVGKKVSFSTSVYENQARYPLAYQHIVDSLQVVPGQGRIKPQDDGGWDFSSAYGYLSVQAAPWMNLQIGHGKHFIGHGYRSLLLSDNAFNYPYLKSTSRFLNDRMEYMWMYAGLQTLERLPVGEVPEALFQKKGANIYYFNWIPHPRVELGLFESVIWNEWNDSTGTESFNYQTLIPVIGVNSLLEKGSDEHHAFLGLNAKIKLTDFLQVYGQYLMSFVSSDTLSQEETPGAYQLGLKGYNVLVPNLDLQLEFNLSNDQVYSNASSQENYFHNNQSIAHPLGSSFQEWVAVANYRHNRIFTQVKGNLQNKSKEFGFTTDRKAQILDLQAGILLNPKTNMNFSIGWVYRNSSSTFENEKTQWVYVAFRTSLHNKYFDF